jgi:LacI family transcriptional regulator
MRVTLKDIAKRAGVSRPAVSMVLNNRDTTHLSEAKKQEVLRLAHEMGYRPNYSALQLRGKSTRVIGVIGTVFSVPVHAAIIEEVMCCFREQGYHVLLGEHGNDTRHEMELVAEFESRGVDGIILFNAVTPRIREIIRVPHAAVSHNQKSYDLCTDLRLGGLLAGRHLTGHGHRKIAFVERCGNSGVLRRQGLIDALAEAGVTFEPSWHLKLEPEQENASAAIKRLLEQGVTAFFTLNDFLGGQVLAELHRLNIRVPEQAAVIGFDGLTFTAGLYPRLTTVVQPVRELGRQTVELMLRRIGGEAPGETPLLLPPHLHIGESCGCRGRMIYPENQTIFKE